MIHIIIIIFIIMCLFISLFLSDKDKTDDSEEMFYHPTTGYKGTKSEMDTYIINKEKKLKK